MFKKIIQKRLKICAQKIIAKYRPKVVAITGSVGKTGTKEFCYAVLKDDFRVWRNLKNFNNEIGVPLTIIGVKNPQFSLLGWLKIFWQARLLLSTKQDFPEILILEMGVDRPGDMDYLLSIVRPQIGIITNIGHSHIEFFKSRENIQKEKGKMIEALPKDGLAILNFDDDLSFSLKQKSKAMVISYGFGEGSDVRADNLSFSDDFSLHFSVDDGAKKEKMLLKNTINKKTIYNVLPAVALGLYFKLPLEKIKKQIQKVQIPQGRMEILKGKKNTTIINDTYNASPESVMALLSSIKENPVFANKRKIAILADMLELGDYSAKTHRKIGGFLAKNNFNALFCFGKEAHNIYQSAKENGLEEVFCFKNKKELSQSLKNYIKENDLLVFKASRGMALEEVVEKMKI